MSTSPARKYLDRYAAPEAAAAAHIDEAYDWAIAIPVKAESASFIEGLSPALPGGGRALAIIVINATETAPDTVHRRNAALHRGLTAQLTSLRWLSPGIAHGALAGFRELDLLLIDRFSPDRRLPPKQGVGMARGIGCDIALALRERGRVRSRWLHTTDADAVLPADYATAAAAAPDDAAALVYPFWHDTSDSEGGEALALYEISLRYYVLGLASAGSPYAFHTLGSALAADADAYAAVRGIPKREAAEDFYLLGKLAKLGRVARAAAAPIRLRERLSDRVPFGTGPAARKIARARAAGEPFRMYNPLVFAAVRQLLRMLDVFVQTRELPDRAPATSDPRFDAAYRHAARAIGAPHAFEQAAAATTSPAALTRRLHGWFDAFRTLKLIHAAEAAGLSRMPWREALATAEFLAGRVDPDAPVRAIREALIAAEAG